MLFFQSLLTTLLAISTCFVHSNNNYISVNKKNVTYKFVPADQLIDNFTQNIFANWKNETFEIFDLVKDPDGIAIDLGAWIGTTAIWLCKNFSHVIPVNADPASLKLLENNLKASECFNATICSHPIAQTKTTFTFRPRINEPKNANDYHVESITFKQLIHDFVYQNESLKDKKISFIKCDIKGGEESILEDILYFAYYNKAKVYISFSLGSWKNHDISRFEYIFKFFKTNCPTDNITAYLQQHPFSSLLFEPLENAGTLIKNNMPVVIIGYNQFTYIKNMVDQLKKYTTDIIIIDNNSTYQPLLDYYNNEFKYTLLIQKKNYGHKIFLQPFIQNLVGNVYIITDPDLKFNSQLPDNFIETFIEISNYFKAYKVGFALCIDSDDIRTDVFSRNESVVEAENNYWKEKLYYPKNPTLTLYKALTDTTFCLINKNFSENCTSCNIRIAGDYTCLHLPWHKNFKDFLLPGEYEYYLKNNVSSTWCKR